MGQPPLGRAWPLPEPLSDLAPTRESPWPREADGAPRPRARSPRRFAASALTVDNDDGAEGLSGLNILHGNSVFGLDGTSTIGEPAGWLSFAPLPPLIDDLNYFSLTPASDIPVDSSLGGFSFQSTTDPGTLAGDDFAVEGIGADSATQIDLGIALLLPEPSAFALLGVAGLFAWWAQASKGRNPEP